MGFLPQASSINLYAYFTQYAREKIFNGDVLDFKVEYFSLHDDDVDYGVSKKVIGVDSSGNTLYNILPSGFIPDVTGDADSCIKSMKNEVVFGINTLTGTSQIIVTPPPSNPPPPPSASRTLTIGFNTVSYTDPTVGTGKNFAYPFVVSLKALVGDASGGPTQGEATTTTFNIEVLEYDPLLIQSISVTPLNPISFPGGGTVSGSLNFIKSNFSPGADPGYSEATTIKLKITPLQSNRTVETGKGILTYTKTLQWN
jgi:hypothetical protein